MTAPAPHGETGERAPLTALEWLRVTHAGTLSGRRIEEAVAAAEARGRAEAAAKWDGLAQTIVDLCWKATPYGGGEDVSAYLLPAGTVHRLIGQAQGAGIPAAFRAIAAPGSQEPQS